MRNAARFLLLVVVFAANAAAWPAGQQAGGGRGAAPPVPGQGQPSAQVGTGFIAGQVLDSPSGKPISDVTVTMAGRVIVNGRLTQSGSAPVLTDAQGRFFFANLPAGTFAFSVNKTGYVSLRANAPLAVELTDGERVSDAKTWLAKVASLTGTLRDEVGDPVVGTDVLVLRRTVTNGRQTLQAVSKTRSDDRGQYRAGSLSPGDYIVCACSRDTIPFDGTLLTTLGSQPLQLMNVAARALSVGSDVVSLDNSLRTYPPTLYPNATSVARATKISLTPGEDKIAVDMNLPLVRSARVSGTVIGASSPVQAFSMRLVPAPDGEASADLFSLPPMLVQADGRFDFAMVPPGQYRLMMVHRETGARGGGPSGAAMSFVGARGATPPPAGASMASAGPALAQELPPLWANEPITVGDNGITGLAISLNRAPRVTGRVQWVGAAPPPPAQMLNRASVVLQPLSFLDPLASLAGTPIGRFSPDATFSVPGAVPGKYIFTSNALPGYPTLKSVTAGGLDITDMAFDVGEKDIAEVVITFVDTPMASLTIVAGPATAGSSGEDKTILVFPADRKFWTEPSAGRRRYRSLPLTSQGTMTTPEMPAGEYFVVVAVGMDAIDWMEATKLEALSRRGQRLTIPDTGIARIEVRR